MNEQRHRHNEGRDYSGPGWSYVPRSDSDEDLDLLDMDGDIDDFEDDLDFDDDALDFDDDDLN